MGSVWSASIAAAGLAAASRVASSSDVPAWDEKSFRLINGLPDGLGRAAWVPMQLGALAAPLVIGAVLATRGHRRVGIKMAVSGVAAWGAAKVVKRAVGRPRPSELIEETRLRTGAADDGLGFPSGHAAVSVCVAGTLADSGATAALAAVPVVVGATRVYVGAHYPLDVLGGWALGAVVVPIVSATVDAIWRT